MRGFRGPGDGRTKGNPAAQCVSPTQVNDGGYFSATALRAFGGVILLRGPEKPPGDPGGS